MKCTCCETLLTGGIDMFGDVNQEMCMWCWFALCEEMNVVYRWRSWADTVALVSNLDEKDEAKVYDQTT